MIRIEIPGWESLDICHIVMDYNGTAAVDGVFLAEAEERILKLKEMAQLYILTADTYGTVKEQCCGLGIEGYDVSARRSGRVQGRNCKRSFRRRSLPWKRTE